MQTLMHGWVTFICMGSCLVRYYAKLSTYFLFLYLILNIRQIVVSKMPAEAMITKLAVRMGETVATLILGTPSCGIRSSA